MNLTEFVTVGTLTVAEVTQPTRRRARRGRDRRAARPVGHAGARPGLWGRLPESLREALLPFAVARVVVAGHARPGPLRRRPHPPVDPGRGGPGAPGPARAGTPAGTRPSPAGLRAPRARVAALLPGGPAARPTCWPGCPGSATARRWCSWPTRRRWPPRRCSTSWCAGRPATGAVARRARLDPQPPARRLRPRHGLCRVAAARAAPSAASWPCGPPPATAPPVRTSPLAGAARLRGGLTRPIGVLLVLAVVAELVRWWPRLGRGERLAGLGAVAAPFVGVARASWPGPSTWWATGGPRCGSSSRARTTGGSRTPSPRCTTTPAGCCTTTSARPCTCPWVLLALAMLVVCWRRLPAPYTLFAAAVLAVAVAGSNLDSFERYALSAFPLSIAAALVLTESQLERAVLALLRPGWPATRCWPSSTSRCRNRRRRHRAQPPFRLRHPPRGTHGGSTNLPCSWSPRPKHPSSSPARAREA